MRCDSAHPDALLTANYDCIQPPPAPVGTGQLSEYLSWLPADALHGDPPLPAVVDAPRLGRALGLADLKLLVSGFWPEAGAECPTGSFKDLEAAVVLGRASQAPRTTLVVASAGNTAAATVEAAGGAGLARRRCVVVVPHSALRRMVCSEPEPGHVTLVSLEPPADYYDAIAFATRLAESPGFIAEGGVANVAKREGLGAAFLAGVQRIGRLPDVYVQAIGSGAGALGAAAMARRLVGAGRYGSTPPRLMLAQNWPFAPVADSWAAGSAKLVLGVDQQKRIEAVVAPELTTRRPAYGQVGGLWEVLSEHGGDIASATNDDAGAAVQLVAEREGIEIEVAAGVAIAALRNWVRTGAVAARDCVLLHVTGCGKSRLRRKRSRELRPGLSIPYERREDPRSLRAAIELVGATSSVGPGYDLEG